MLMRPLGEVRLVKCGIDVDNHTDNQNLGERLVTIRYSGPVSE